MKIFSSYLKEMKIASKGFYFYLEFIVAFLLLAVLMLAVPKTAGMKVKEVVFMDMSQSAFEAVISNVTINENHEYEGVTTFKLKPASIQYTDLQTGELHTKTFEDKKSVDLDTYNYFDSETGQNTKVKYFTDNFEDMLRIAYSKRYYGSVMSYDDQGKVEYVTILRGNETDRYIKLLSTVHTEVDQNEIVKEMDQIKIAYLEPVEILDNRQNYIPLVITFMCGLMSVFILIAYISIDKAEGLIKAFSVAPVSMYQYLISKMLVVMTTSIASSLIITIPVMGFQPNYLVLVILILSLTILGSCIALVVGSYFNDIIDGFGAIFVVIIALMLPTLSYLMPSFSPTWVKFVPSYYMLEASKEAILINGDIRYVILSSSGMLLISIFLFLWANHRYTKTLTI